MTKDKLTLTDILLSLVNECEECAMRGERIMCQTAPKEEMRLKCIATAREAIVKLLPDWKITKPFTEKDEIIDLLEDGKLVGWNAYREQALKNMEG